VRPSPGGLDAGARICGAAIAVIGIVGPAAPVHVAGQTATRMIWVQATVTDADGHVVTGLGKEAFTVTDGDVVRPIRAFSGEEMPAAISLMLDLSGSMRDALPTVRLAAEALLDQFIPGDRVNVGTFAPGVSATFTANRRRILDTIQSALLPMGFGSERTVPCTPPSKPTHAVLGLPRPGGTWMWDAVECGIRALETDGEAFRRALILVTDGKEEGGYATKASALEMANRVGVLVYAVGLRGTLGRADSRLQDLTRESGGGYYPLEDGQDFASAFKRIAEELHGQYVLGIESEARAKGPLNVAVNRPGVTVRATKGVVTSVRR
jgi:Ca-activated chloride channel homolog